ncbi:hypothetical protein F2Q69_00008421, partial [Brassica cretica]
MENNCDLELRLFPTSSYDESDTSVVESRSCGNSLSKEEESQRITIFYSEKMYVSSNVTHLQAKSIILIASREMEERSSSNGSDPRNRLTRLHHHQLPNPKASMKRSLQSFLQKRRIRIQAASPYHHHSRPYLIQNGNSLSKEEESQRITIFYSEKMYVSSNVTHLQAKSIILIASREMEERSSSNGSDPRN